MTALLTATVPKVTSTYNSWAIVSGCKSSVGMICRYDGSLTSVWLLIAIMVAVRLVAIDIRAVSLL